MTLDPKEVDGEEDEQTRLLKTNPLIFPASDSSLLASPAPGLGRAAILVVVAELCERLCYYGIAQTYVVYMSTMLMFSDPKINAVTSLFVFGAYLVVLLGGYVADRYWGRYRTILLALATYMIGLLLLTLSASPLGYHDFPYDPTWATQGLIAGLVFIALGTGGIKANVGALMGDQLGPDASRELIARAFSYFYWGINLGAMLGMLFSPYLKRVGGSWATPNGSSPTDACVPSSSSSGTKMYVGYYVSYAVMTSVFVVGVLVFVAGHGFYVLRPPTGSLMQRSCALCRRARRNRRWRRANDAVNDDSIGGPKAHWLDWATEDPSDPDFALLQDLKRTLRAVTVFLPFPIYSLLYLQMANTFVLQAQLMRLPGGITADQLGLSDPVFLILFIPIFDRCVFPALRARGWRLSSVDRMTLGFALVALAMFGASALQAGIDATGESVPCFSLTANETRTVFRVDPRKSVNVFWQLPVYFCVALSEIFATVASYEYAYAKAPSSMKSVVMAVSQVQMALGAALGLALSPLVVPENFKWLFLAYGLVMLVFAACFYAVFRDWDREDEEREQ